MDRPEHCAHRSYLTDFIQVTLLPKKLDPTEIKRLYLEEDLSASQIGEKFGVSKQMILARLRGAGIHRAPGRGRSPDNFRYPHPIYGYRVAEGRLATHTKEMKAVRLIVELRDRKGHGWKVISDSLNQKGFRSRTGLIWNRVRVKRVHKHWSGKL